MDGIEAATHDTGRVSEDSEEAALVAETEQPRRNPPRPRRATWAWALAANA